MGYGGLNVITDVQQNGGRGGAELDMNLATEPWNLVNCYNPPMGFLLVCSTRSSTYCIGRSSFCSDELTDAHLPTDQQLHKRPNDM